MKVNVKLFKDVFKTKQIIFNNKLKGTQYVNVLKMYNNKWLKTKKQASINFLLISRAHTHRIFLFPTTQLKYGNNYKLLMYM